MATSTCELCQSTNCSDVQCPKHRRQFEAARDTNGAGEVVASSMTSGAAEGDRASFGESTCTPKAPFLRICTGCEVPVRHHEMHHGTGVRESAALQPGEAHDSADLPSPLLPSLPAATSDATVSYHKPPDSERNSSDADCADRSPLDRVFFYPEDQAQAVMMEAPECQLSSPERLDDRAPQQCQHVPQESQEPSFENAAKAFEDGAVGQEKKMDHQDAKDPVLRVRDAGDYFGDPTPRISRLTTLLAAQGAYKMLENRSPQALKEYENPCPIAPKEATSTERSRIPCEACRQPELSDVGRSWRPSSEQAQNDALYDDSGDSVEHLMSKLGDLTIEPDYSQRCHVPTACEHFAADSTHILGTVERQLADMGMNPHHAETPMAASRFETEGTDIHSPMP